MKLLKTSTTVALSMAFGIAAGAAVTAFADQPNMQAALDHLVAARAYLEKANDNKAGHREKAMSLVDLAIGEVKEGMKAAD
jgi:hypothetical protein